MGANGIRLTGALLLTALTATGCSPDVERLDGQAAPAGVTTHATTPPTTTPPTTAAATTAPAAPSTAASPSSSPSSSPRTFQQRLVLGPAGLGGLKLRMTRERAEGTGLIEGYEVEDFTGNCGVARLRSTGDTVYFTPGLGLSGIYAPDGVRTPEGIRVGSPVTEVKAAYPTWKAIVTGDDNAQDWGWVDVPGSSDDGYRIDVKGGKVTSIVLAAEGQKCIE
jgi:hypothetical protein